MLIDQVKMLIGQFQMLIAPFSWSMIVLIGQVAIKIGQLLFFFLEIKSMHICFSKNFDYLILYLEK